MLPRVNIFSGKVSEASINEAEGSGSVLRHHQGFQGVEHPNKNFLSSKEHLDWLKIDLNAAEIFTVQDHKYKKTNVN